LREPSFRQLAAAPELRISPSAVVTTTTTLPTSKPIGDACSVERVEPKVEEASIEKRNLLPTLRVVKGVLRANCGGDRVTTRFYYQFL
jgi:hypothetical protein